MAGSRRDRISFREEVSADGQITQYARFWIPKKQKGGGFTWERTERSTRTGDRNKAFKIADAIRQSFIERAYSGISDEVAETTFAKAATTYMQTKGKKRFIAPVLQHFGTATLSEITQASVNECADALYPNGSKAHRNRAVYTPIIAILNLAANDQLCPPPRIQRPEGHTPKSLPELPPDEWFDDLMPRLRPNLAAAVLFWTLHGRRTGEGIDRTPANLDPKTWALTIGKTKTGQPVQIVLSPPVIEALQVYEWRKGERLFGYKTKSGAYKALRAACAAAGIKYYSPKDFGRHKFATRLLSEGKSLKFVKEAGRWATIRMPAEIYGHLEHSEVDTEVNKVGTEWAKKLAAPKRLKVVNLGGNVGEIDGHS